MINADDAEPFLLSIATRPNRSLSKRGRRLWLMLIAASVLVVSAGAVMVGAWVILPFAGFEVLLVWLAFYVIGQHDMDYETLVVTNSEFRWEARNGIKIETLEGSRDWAKFCRSGDKFGPDKIHLLYGGNKVAVGRLMNALQRQELAKRMALVFRCVAP